MRQVIILSLVCVSVFLTPLKLAAKVEGPVSGRLVKHSCLPHGIKKQGEVTSRNGTNKTK